MKGIARLLVLALPFMLLIAACTQAAPLPEPTAERSTVIIGYSAPVFAGTQLQIQQGLETHAKAQGWQVITTASGGDPEKQAEQIAHFIALGVSAIVAVPDDSKRICASIEQAQAAGIPFYTIDRSPDGCEVNMTVLSDNYLAGKQSGEAMVQLLTERYGEPSGVVLELAGNMATNVAQMRAQGFRDVLSAYPQITLITKESDWDGAKGAEFVTELLSAGTVLDGIYAHSDGVYFDPVIAALREQGQLKARNEAGHVFLTGVDGSPEGIKAIRDGFADQVSNQPLPDFGIIAEWIAKDLRGEAISVGQVTRDGALWSPAVVKQSPIGLQLFLSTTSVTIENVEHPGLWANK